MSKGFLIIFGILLILPVFIAAIVLCYTCFKTFGIAAGFIAIGVCILFAAIAAIVVAKKSKVTK